MTDPIAAKGLAKRFWEKKPLNKMAQDEWEALCDGCGKCCLNKLEDEDTEEVALTRVACAARPGLARSTETTESPRPESGLYWVW